MPGKCKFQNLWLEDEQWIKWLRKHGTDVYSAFCMYCKKSFDISHSGINSIKLHSKGKKHASIENNLKSNKQRSLIHCFDQSRPSPSTPRPNTSLEMGESSKSCEPISSNIGQEIASTSSILKESPPIRIQSYLLSDSVTRAEILWAAYCVLTNTSTRHGALATDIFSLLFPDSSIASKLQLQKDKISYSVTYGLGPYCLSNVAMNARQSPFYALSIDECLNDISQKQQMDFMVNYWNNNEQMVDTRYLTSAFLQKTSAVDLLDSVRSSIREANLPLDRLIQVSTDGPNVNLKLIFDLKTHMRESLESSMEILDVGTCSLHIINGAYKTAHAKSNWKLNQFMRQLYQLFKNYPSRRATFSQITGSNVFPKKFCAVRWTENSGVIRRSLEILPHLKTYFRDIKEPPATENFAAVKSFVLDDPTIEAKLHFSAMIAEELEEFLVKFQKNTPLLPFLHQEVFALMKSLASKFLKANLISSATTASKLKKIDINDSKSILNVDHIDIGFGARSCLKKVKEVHAQRFKLDCKNFYVQMYKKLIEKSPLNKKIVTGASCLSPSVMANEIMRISRAKLAIDALIECCQISAASGDIILRQYTRFCESTSVEKLNNFNWKKERLDCFLFSLFEGQDIKTELKLFFQRILVMFHGNAAVERSFSFNKNFLVENLLEKSLIAQRALHDTINSLPGGLKSLDITKQMMMEFRSASSRRKEDLKRKKEEEDDASFKKKLSVLEMKNLKMKKQQLLEEKEEQLLAIDNKIKALKNVL